MKVQDKIKFPLKYEDGSVKDADGNTLIKANREAGTTPLAPSERDDLLKLVADLLNDQFA